MTTTFVLYMIQGVLAKLVKDYNKVVSLNMNIPTILFTPTLRVLVGLYGFSASTFLHDIYVREIYEQLPEYRPESGWIIVDAGANIGLYTLLAADANPKITIALEPDPRNYVKLRRNLRINRISSVKALPYALASTNRCCDFILSRDLFHSHIADGTVDQRAITVKAVSLEHILTVFKLDHVDLLKLDVEGGEHDIITLQNEALTHGLVEKIVGELHGRKDDVCALIEKLKTLDFRIEFLQNAETSTIHTRYAPKLDTNIEYSSKRNR